MKKILIGLAVLLVTMGSAQAYCTSSVVGSTTFHSWSDGTSGTSSSVGGTTFHNWSDGTSGTSSRIGGTTFHD